jgi:16S rRNA processing protein RimM
MVKRSMMPADDGWICLGHISAAHGVRGDVLIRSHTQAREDITAYGPLYDEAGTRAFDISIKQVTTKGIVARIAGTNDRNAAEALKGTQLFVARARLPDTEPGEWYQSDLVGLSAVDPDGNPLGRIIAVQDFGAGDLLELRPQAGGETVLVPFTHETVPEVDIAAGRVVIVAPAGLFGDA